MNGDTLIGLALLIPLIGAVFIPLTAWNPNLRETVTLLTAASLFFMVAAMAMRVLDGARPELEVLEVLPGLRLAFEVEPLGMLFACVASTLWIVNSIYSIGYMRGNNEPRQTQFYVCFAVALASTMGIAFAANLFTLFLFYEVLTLSTYPLVTHKADENAINGGRVYLLILLGTSMVLLLPAIVATAVIAGTLDFAPGGILSGKADGAMVGMLLALFMFGIGKAALMPFHRWLPAAMVAPTPVSALLHAVAVVKAGVFTAMKVVLYVFGIDLLAGSGQNDWLIFLASASLLIGSLVALTKDNLKARLAYSTVSQLAYVVLGAALATSWGVIGGSMHIAMHAVGKITLFFCAGAIYTAAHKTEVSELTGLGRTMPFTFAAFLIGSLSIIGLPPFGGVWGKWYLALGALDAGHVIVVAVLMISSLLNIAYLLPIPLKAFFGGTAAAGRPAKIKEAPLPCLIAIGLTSLGCLLLFFYPGVILQLLQLIPLR
ncbi:MAG: monovalent cation/H+ antiporter subunit D family protein [Pseudomonadota bacterium]|nr:monovalent cation/H+ antiporter subunit D family protein [Pseudomonadota bacterium]